MNQLHELRKRVDELHELVAEVQAQVQAARNQGWAWAEVARVFGQPASLPGGASETTVRRFYRERGID